MKHYPNQRLGGLVRTEENSSSLFFLREVSTGCPRSDYWVIELCRFSLVRANMFLQHEDGETIVSSLLDILEQVSDAFISFYHNLLVCY